MANNSYINFVQVNNATARVQTKKQSNIQNGKSAFFFLSRNTNAFNKGTFVVDIWNSKSL